jgi:hypothetical protein
VHAAHHLHNNLYATFLTPLPHSPRSLSLAWDHAEYPEQPDDFEAVLRELPPDLMGVASDVRQYIGDVLRAVQTHHHRPTCAKGQHRADDSGCRMEYPRVLIDSDVVLRDGVSFLLRRNQGPLVPFMPTLMLGVPSNHVCTLLSEAGRWLRDVVLAIERNEPPPPIPDAALHAAMICEYVTKYTTKADETAKANDALLHAATKIHQKHEEAGAAHKPPFKRSRSTLARCMNKIVGTQTYGIVLASTYLLGYGDHDFSHQCKVHNASAFASMLHTDFAHSCTDESHQTLVGSGEGDTDRVFMTDAVANYHARSAALQSCSPIEMTMAFSLERHRSGTPHMLRLNANHPQYMTHSFTAPRTLSLPQLISNPPLCPADDSTDTAAQQRYAAWALANYFPNGAMLDALAGETLWEKMLDWRESRPRGARDNLAFRMLHNLQQRQLACAAIKAQHKSGGGSVNLASNLAAGFAGSDDSDEEEDSDAFDDDEEFFTVFTCTRPEDPGAWVKA